MSSRHSRNESPAGPVSRRWPAALIAVVYLLLSLTYGAVNPLFEAPDEHWHYFTAQTIADEWRLPRVEDPPDPWLGQEAAQPPLYYVAGALLIAPLDTAGARALVWPNPRVALGDASSVNNINAFVHGPWEAWPWRGYVLAAHLLRVFSSLLGLGTLLFIYGSARELWPTCTRRALLAMALVAFLPQFLFVHSAVTNDTMITLLCAAAIWQLLRLWRSPGQKRALLALGVTIGLAILSKIAGLLLLALACGVLLLRAWQRGEAFWRAVLRTATLVALPALLTGGWLLLRNWMLYGDITAASQFVAIAGGERAFTLRQVIAESGGLWISLFAMFGWFNVRAPDWIYWLWNGLALFGALGAVWRTWSEQRNAAGAWRINERWLLVAWLALWLLLVYGGLVAFMLRTPAAQGRLLFPALTPLALFTAYGLDAFGRLRSVWPLLALATALTSILLVIPRAYAQPSQMPPGNLPQDAVGVQMPLDGQLALVGYQVETPQVEPGDTVYATLFWRALAPHEDRKDAPQVVAEIFGRGGELVGKFQGYHHRGLYPAPLWPSGAIVVEQLAVPLTRTVHAPAELTLQIGLTSSAQRQTLATLEVEPAQWPDPPGAELARLGEAIGLVQAAMTPPQVTAGDPLTVTLSWRVHQDVQQPFTTFVHLGDPAAPPVAQGDGPPLGGFYPTYRWEAGEVIAGDEYVISTRSTLAPGRYPIWVGLYDPRDGQRLPLFVAGERQAFDAWLVGWVLVQPPQ